ncbi:putative mitochondrial group I intron splicing factor CCM1 [[Candida] jaroonii]|uniref:Mitochondrial group I intron splicing factor CCM1 n=1 Tax=[Candida] jaroonii TaxID=467808 RepID=A0ACA9YDI5_9ASCO|nr:putative mitochondrial group I intron splicing factor CCM1 [[Candida] jaroonii]
MIPIRQVIKTVGRRNLKPLGIRFQSVAVNNVTDSTTTPTVNPNTKGMTNTSESTKRQTRPPIKYEGYSQARNQKHREIVNSIHETIKGGNFEESLEILEEGISFLREIQQDEKLSPILVYSDFVRLSADLLEQYLQSGKDYSKLMSILSKYDISHHYHYFLLMKNELKLNSDDKYEKILNIWVQYLESNGSRTHLKFLDELNYRFKNFSDLTYFAYCQGFLKGNYTYSSNDILSLLKFEQEPFPYQVRPTLNDLKIPFKEISPFLNMFKFISSDNLDPNSNLTMRKLQEFVQSKDDKKLWEFFETVKKSSNEQQSKINNLTIFKFMSSFYDLEKFDYNFRIFQDILNSNPETIDKSIWELVIKSIGHTNYVTKFDTKGKETLSRNLSSMISTMTSDPNFKMDSKMLSSIVGSYANLNDFTKIDELLKTYNKLPLVQIGKNKILLGLIINDKIVESEKKLKEFMKQDKNFKPATNVMNSYLNHYCKNENFDAVNGLIEFMKSNKIPEDVATLTILIDNYSKLNFKQGKRIDFNEIFNILNNSNLKLNDKTYSVLIESIIRDGNNINAAREIFNHLMNTEYKNKRISNELLISMLNGELNIGSIESAEKLFNLYIKTSGNTVRVWNMMISNCLKKHENLALNYYEQLKSQKNLSPNFFTFYFMLAHFSKKGNKVVLQRLVNDLDKSGISDLGNQIPKILSSIQDKVTLPEKLKKQIN